MDEVETLAEDLLRRLFSFGPEFRGTIQPHSGTQANQIVFNAVLQPTDTVLSLKAQDGGHISHKVLVGRRNQVHFYGLTADARIDYEQLRRLALELRPRLIIAGGSSYPREIAFAAIAKIAEESGALLHADISHTATFVAAGVHRSVFPWADFVTFNTVKNLRGPNGGVLIYRRNHHERVNRAIFPGTQGGPNENTMFGKLVALDILLRTDLRRYAQRMVVLSNLFASTLTARGIDVVTGGSDSHLLLVDLRRQPCTGAEVEQRCEAGQVLLNRNLVPGDLRQPWITSGIRIGTACLAILGYTDSDAQLLAEWIADRVERSNCDAGDLPATLASRYNGSLRPLEKR